MDSDTLNDLKQFIEATVSQHTAMLRKDTEEIVKNAINELREELDENQNEVLNAIGGSLQSQDEQLGEHERRITRLEHAA